MKRLRRLPPEKRQKVSTACDGCKKRKFKCTGTNPCRLCLKKGYECTYSIVDKRSLKGQRLAIEREEKESKEKRDCKKELKLTELSTSNIETPKTDESSNQPLMSYEPSKTIPTMIPHLIVNSLPNEILVNSHLSNDLTMKQKSFIAIPNNLNANNHIPFLQVPISISLPSPSISPKNSFSKNVINTEPVLIKDNKVYYRSRANINTMIDEFNQLNFNQDYFTKFEVYKDFSMNELKIINLPLKIEVENKLEKFHEIYGKWGIIDSEQIHQIIERIYSNSNDSNVNFIILYLILSLIENNEELSINYFKSGLILLDNEGFKPDLKLIQINFLIFFQFKKLNDLNKCYYYLGIVINLSKLIDNLDFNLTMNKSIAINDTLLSIIMGKQAQLNLSSSFNLNHEQTEIDQQFKLIIILNKILINFYDNNYHLINIFKIKDLSIELKFWSLNNLIDDTNLNLINLSTILLLTKPLFIFHLFNYQKNNLLDYNKLKDLSKDYFISCLNLSIHINLNISKFSVINDYSINFLNQSCQIIYISIIFFQKYNINYDFNVDYLKFVLNLGIKYVHPDHVKNYEKIVDDLQEFDINDGNLKGFQNNFVDNEIAPTFKLSI